jgi:hypothetical protein
MKTNTLFNIIIAVLAMFGFSSCNTTTVIVGGTGGTGSGERYTVVGPARAGVPCPSGHRIINVGGRPMLCRMNSGGNYNQNFGFSGMGHFGNMSGNSWGNNGGFSPLAPQRNLPRYHGGYSSPNYPGVRPDGTYDGR